MVKTNQEVTNQVLDSFQNFLKQQRLNYVVSSKKFVAINKTEYNQFKPSE
jgi:hypothetical protein